MTEFEKHLRGDEESDRRIWNQIRSRLTNERTNRLRRRTWALNLACAVFLSIAAVFAALYFTKDVNPPKVFHLKDLNERSLNYEQLIEWNGERRLLLPDMQTYFIDFVSAEEIYLNNESFASVSRFCYNININFELICSVRNEFQVEIAVPEEAEKFLYGNHEVLIWDSDGVQFLYSESGKQRYWLTAVSPFIDFESIAASIFGEPQ